MSYVRLGDLCVINSGGTPRRNNESYWKNGDIPWVKISDLKNGIVESTEEFITLDGLNNSSAKIFPKGTLLYTIFATIGEVAILKMDAATNQAIVGIQLKENKKVYLKYIYYYLKSQTNNIKQLGRGVAQNNINLLVVKNMIIPIVSLEKQSNIIATLNKLEKIKGNRITILNCLDDLIKSRFVEMFGDPNASRTKYKLVPIHMVTDCMVPGRDKPKSFTGEIPWITINDLNVNGYTNKSKLGLGLTIDEVKEVNRKCVPQGSVLMSCVGNLGLCSIASVDVVINQQLHSYQCNEFINNLYLMYYLSFKNTYMNKIASSTTVLYMNKNACNNIPVLLPPIDLQISFAKYLNQINKLKSDVQKSIDETQLLMDSLMQEYFG